MPRVLIADDDRDLCALLAEYLAGHGFDVDVAHDGHAALDAIEDPSGPMPDAAVLDIMMPGMDGLEVLRNVRARHSIPLLMLSGRGGTTDRIVGLEMGADDYLQKPCSPRELVARLRAVLRRGAGGASLIQAPGTALVDANDLGPLHAEDGTGDLTIPHTGLHAGPQPGLTATTGTASAEPMTVNTSAAHSTAKGGIWLCQGDLMLCPASRTAQRGDEELVLTGAEFTVLQTLVENAGMVVSKETLSRRALGRAVGAFDRSIDTHISRVRRKLGPAPDGSPRIKTIRSSGYLFVPSLPVRASA